MNKAYYIGILLYRSRLAEVGKLRAFPLLAVATAFNRSVKLRQRYHRYIQLFRQLFQRARNHTHLLLAASEFHARGIHQLKIVYYYYLHSFFPNEATRLGTQFEDGERRRIIHKHRRAVKILYTGHKLVPFHSRELAASDFLARNFTDVAHQTVHQLQVRHFKREQRHRGIVINGHVLCHGQHESCFTHGRTCRYYYKV